jgi:hypothetical protein
VVAVLTLRILSLIWLMLLLFSSLCMPSTAIRWAAYGIVFALHNHSTYININVHTIYERYITTNLYSNANIIINDNGHKHFLFVCLCHPGYRVIRNWQTAFQT